MTLVPKIVDGLRVIELDDVLVVVGGTIPAEDAAELKRLGIAEVFTPGAPTSRDRRFPPRTSPCCDPASRARGGGGARHRRSARRHEPRSATSRRSRRCSDRLLELRDDSDVRAVVLTPAAGDPRRSSHGADIKAMNEMDVEQADAAGAHVHEAATLLETIPKPTVAAINGFALGGGCELALACDIRYASPAAKLGQPEINLGIVPGWGGTQRLARVCGLGFAKELILTGRVVGAEEALQRGLVNGLHDPPIDKALETARFRFEGPTGARRREGGDERRAPGRPRGEPRGRGRPLRRPLRERGREGRPDRLLEKRDATFSGR